MSVVKSFSGCLESSACVQMAVCGANSCRCYGRVIVADPTTTTTTSMRRSSSGSSGSSIIIVGYI